MGFLLIFVAILTIASMIINNHILWFVTDCIVIVTTSAAGILFLRQPATGQQH